MAVTERGQIEVLAGELLFRNNCSSGRVRSQLMRSVAQVNPEGRLTECS